MILEVQYLYLCLAGKVEVRGCNCLAILKTSDIVDPFEECYAETILNSLNLYQALLPIKFIGESISILADKIINIYEGDLQYINEKGDKWSEVGRLNFKSQLLFYISRGVQIEMLLPAFPCKSNNRNKTLGFMPDKGEELALELISSFCQKINTIYEPGIKFNIVSDGRVFADLFLIPDNYVDEYDYALRNDFPNLVKNIQFYDLEVFLKTNFKHDEARFKLLTLFGKSKSLIKSEILISEDYKKMYLGFSRFVREDVFFILDGSNVLQSTSNKRIISVTKCKKKSHDIAVHVMRRNDAYSKMVEIFFPLHIRVSIHAHDNSGPKYAIRLLPLNKFSSSIDEIKNMHIPTPWHNVVVEDINGKYTLMKNYKVKNSEAYEIIQSKRGQPYFYKQTK